MRTSLHRLTLLAWLSVLAAAIALLLELDSRFPTPPLDGAAAVRDWWSAQDPLDAVAGVARLLCLALVSYLFAVSILQLVARRRGWHRCANAAGRAAPRFVAVFIAALVATTTSAGAARATGAAGHVDVPHPSAGSGAQMVLLDEGSTAASRAPSPSSTSTVAAPAPTAAAHPRRSLPFAGAPTTSAAVGTRSTTSTVSTQPAPTTTTGAGSGSSTTVVAPSTTTPGPGPEGASAITRTDVPATGGGVGTAASEVDVPPTDPGTVRSGQAPAAVPPDTPGSGSTTSYVVLPGDHLWGIAEQTLAARTGGQPSDREVSSYWRELVRANEHRLVEPGNADLIIPGQHLELPA